MSAELFFTSIFAGYWFRRILRSTRYATLRAAGYHVLFKSILAGSALLVIARGILWLFDGMNLAPLMGDEIVEKLLQSFSEEGPHYLDMLVLTGVLALLLPYLMNLFPRVREKWKREKQIQRLIVHLEHPSRFKRSLYKIWYGLFCTKESAMWMDTASRGDVTEMTFLRSLHNQDLIELVMQDRSYIGFVAEREITETGNMLEVGLVPLVRTYLSTKTERLHIYQYASDVEGFDEKEKVVVFRLSSIRFVRYIRYDKDKGVENYLEKMLKETPSKSRSYVPAAETTAPATPVS